MVRPGDTLWTICGEMFPSPHSGILFLYKVTLRNGESVWDGFRPLIRGFFFYPLTETVSSLRRLGKVSVPLFGDSFFMVVIRPTFSGKYAVVSVPLFGDSFFIFVQVTVSALAGENVSVPLFGDSFFMIRRLWQKP